MCAALCVLMDCKHNRLLWPWGFSRQEYWSALPFPTPEGLPNPGIKQWKQLKHLIQRLNSYFCSLTKAAGLLPQQRQFSVMCVLELTESPKDTLFFFFSPNVTQSFSFLINPMTFPWQSCRSHEVNWLLTLPALQIPKLNIFLRPAAIFWAETLNLRTYSESYSEALETVGLPHCQH